MNTDRPWSVSPPPRAHSARARAYAQIGLAFLIAFAFTSALLALGCSGEHVEVQVPITILLESQDADPCELDDDGERLGCPGNACIHGACWVDGAWDMDTCAGEDVDDGDPGVCWVEPGSLVTP